MGQDSADSVFIFVSSLSSATGFWHRFVAALRFGHRNDAVDVVVAVENHLFATITTISLRFEGVKAKMAAISAMATDNFIPELLSRSGLLSCAGRKIPFL